MAIRFSRAGDAMRLSTKSIKTPTSPIARREPHPRPHLCHHSTARVRTKSRLRRRTWRIVCGLEDEVMTGYPKKGFRGDVGARNTEEDGDRLMDGPCRTLGSVDRDDEADAAEKSEGQEGAVCILWYSERSASSI